MARAARKPLRRLPSCEPFNGSAQLRKDSAGWLVVFELSRDITSLDSALDSLNSALNSLDSALNSLDSAPNSCPYKENQF